jgi:flotillin
LKIDKITVWDTGSGNGHMGGRNTTADFLAGLVGSLPRLHELAQQAGIELPPLFGKVDQSGHAYAKVVEPKVPVVETKPAVVDGKSRTGERG